MTYIVKYPICSKLYKCYYNGKYITDFGDDVTNYCIMCKNKITPIVIRTTDWIADLVFKIKGN